jgi:hypothetical protein
MPKGYKAAGQKLWRTVNAIFELDEEPHKVELLTQACRVADIVAELDRAAVKAPLTVRGSAGQQVISPQLAEARFQRGLLATLLGRLGLPDTDEAVADKAEKLSQTRRRAANSGPGPRYR